MKITGTFEGGNPQNPQSIVHSGENTFAIHPFSEDEDPIYKFRLDVKVLENGGASQRVKLRIHWNTTTEKWYLSIEGLNNDVDIRGIALMTGKDLLAPYGYYELGELWVVDNQGENADPDYDDIGGRFTLEYTPLS